MFKRLLYVYTVYKEQSFTKAAQKLFVSQPSLSAAIKKTEEEIGFPLFERGFSPIRTTQIGQKYIEAAEEILRIESNFTAFLEDTQELRQGNLSIGGSNYVSSYIIPRLVSRFADLYPLINITLQETNSVELEAYIKSETIDLVIDSYDESNPTYQGHPLMKEKIMLAVPKERVINASFKEFQTFPSQIFQRTVNYSEVPSLSIQEFQEEKFILLKNGNDMYSRAKHIFKQGKIAPQVIFHLDQLMTSYNLSASGVGACFVTDTLFKCNAYADDVCLYNITESEPRTLHIAHKKGRYCTRAMEEFIRIAKETIQ